MNYDPMIPIWLQVATSLRQDMVSGRLPPGAKLPGGRELAVQYAINPNTAARVYQELERDGLCETRRGLGTFVTTDATLLRTLRLQLAREAVQRCLRGLIGLGMSPAEALALMEAEAHIAAAGATTAEPIKEDIHAEEH